MARFYTNENFPIPAAKVLRELGHDVLTIQETGMAGQRVDDRSVLAFAAAERRVLVTLNRRHFVRLHEESPQHAGIVVCTVDPDVGALAHRIDAAVREVGPTDGVLLRVNRPGR